MSEKQPMEFRIQLSLSSYYSDERAHGYMDVNSGRDVRWLHRQVEQEYGLDTPFCLVNRGYLLPSTENLGTLTSEDVVEVIPVRKKSEDATCSGSNPDGNNMDQSQIEESTVADGHEENNITDEVTMSIVISVPDNCEQNINEIDLTNQSANITADHLPVDEMQQEIGTGAQGEVAVTLSSAIFDRAQIDRKRPSNTHSETDIYSQASTSRLSELVPTDSKRQRSEGYEGVNFNHEFASTGHFSGWNIESSQTLREDCNENLSENGNPSSINSK